MGQKGFNSGFKRHGGIVEENHAKLARIPVLDLVHVCVPERPDRR